MGVFRNSTLQTDAVTRDGIHAARQGAQQQRGTLLATRNLLHFNNIMLGLFVVSFMSLPFLQLAAAQSGSASSAPVSQESYNNPLTLLQPETLVAYFSLDGSANDTLASIPASSGARYGLAANISGSLPSFVPPVVTTSGNLLPTTGVRKQGMFFDGASKIVRAVDIGPMALPDVTFGAWVRGEVSNFGSSGQSYDEKR